jgi:hypothetical protein
MTARHDGPVSASICGRSAAAVRTATVHRMTRPTLLAASAFLLVSIALPACLTGGGSDSSPSPSVAGSASAGSGAASEQPSSSARNVQPTSFAIGSLVRATAARLRVREAPGLAAQSLGTLPDGARSIVVEGPVGADGHEWYRVHALGLPMGTGCTGPYETDPFSCPGWFGWVAASGADGAAWLVEDTASCPDWPETRVSEELVFGGRGPLEYLACFGAEDRTLVGFYPTIPDDAGLGGVCESPEGLDWLACDPGYEQLMLDAQDDFFAEGFRLAIPPEVAMPERGHMIEVTGHYDDPAARECTHGTPPEETVLFCRARFVVTSARAVGG